MPHKIIEANLPTFLRPKKIESLVRLGKNNDGGYLIDERNIKRSSYLISFGMATDWSFENDFYSLTQIPMYVYDASVTRKKLRKSCFKLRRIISRIKTYSSYKSFFNGQKKHIEQFVGFDCPPRYISLSSILSDSRFEKGRIFFNIDIEGWEYRILDELILYSDKIEGLVIEFHDVDIHLDKIEDFIENFPLNLVHVHCNNHAIVSEKGIPLVIECTFTSLPVSDDFVNGLPNSLDQPCHKLNDDYLVQFNLNN